MRYRGPTGAGGRRRVGDEMKQVAEEEKGWRMEGEIDKAVKQGCRAEGREGGREGQRTLRR